MRFKDIQPYIAPGSYQVNVDLPYFKIHMDRYFEYGLQMNPDFQRGHVWTEAQQIAFMEYFLRGGESGRTIYFNHPGWRSDYEGDFVVVDGLQRLTAAMKLLNDEIRVFPTADHPLGHLYSEIEGRPNPSINFIFNVNCLRTRKEVLSWYLQMNSGGTPHTEDELNKVKKLLATSE